MSNKRFEFNNANFCFDTRKSAKKSSSYIFGLPLQMGKFHSIDELAIFDIHGTRYPTHFTTKSYWPDKSLKWVTATSLLKTDQQYLIQPAMPSTLQDADDQQSNSQQTESQLTVEETGIRCMATGLRFMFNYEQQFQSSIALKLISKESNFRGSYESLKAVFVVSNQDDIFAILDVGYSHASGETQISLRIENRRAAIHEQGTWDLGDPNSEIIKRLSLTISFDTPRTSELYLRDDATGSSDIFAINDLQLRQLSSGGKSWQSPTHVDANGEITVSQQGFELTQAGKTIHQGLRANPTFKISEESASFWLCPIDFWQNFPATITAVRTSLTWDLFPNTTELQPGESKRWQLQIIPSDLLHDQTEMPSPEEMQVRLNPDYINHCGVFPSIHLSAKNMFSDIIQKGVKGEDSFFEKREACDEYGWRNYGELYADHETLNQPKEPIFISHYNNQYDTILGTTVQKLCWPTSDWHQIADPLVKHVQDIDIYNTDGDKPEYNGGQFWHTDHYLPAETCTHRTYSKKHTSVYDGHQGGGGPGGQHCYTSGLLWRALVDNDQIAAEKVLQLTHWIRRFYNGNNSLFGRLHRFLTVDLKPNQLTNVGIVHKGYKYPLDRGTGNYLNALIDSYELTREDGLLSELATVIRQTVGLGDNLDERELDNIENSWFYTVFLQALIKYLLLKESLQQNDQDYAYARALLAKFGEWMLKHEVPYLTHPEKLEFPNDTWAAQDVRKATIFSYLAYFETANRFEYREKAEFFVSYVTDKLASSSESHTTRILAILMQNYGLIERANLLGNCTVVPLPLNQKDIMSTGSPAVIRLIKDMLKIIIRFSPKAEWQWLRSRVGTPVVNRGDRHD